MTRLLIIDDDQAICRTLHLHFGERGFEVDTANNVEDGLAKLSSSPADVVVSDIRMPDRDGLSLLRDIRERMPDIPVIMITAFQDLDSTVAAMHGGAVDYVPKPIDINELEAAVDRAIRMGGGDDGLVLGSGDASGTIIGRSRPMQEVFKAIGMVSQSSVTVLILGESGTGKELVTHAIHQASPQANEPFVAVNCAALVETLLESEMFGHEKGSFTGAVSAHKGKVELAGEGTLFLDEVGELSQRMQGKLLRLLEEREYVRVGGSGPRHSGARFIAATNADLAAKVESGEFREDLYYRLNVFSINLPPLRERREDIPVLVEHLLKKISREFHKGIRRVPADVMDRLLAYDWPGNVRELENVLMRAAVLAPGDALAATELPDVVAANEDLATDQARAANAVGTNEPVSLKELERKHIAWVLSETGWHKGKACEILGISRPRLERRIKEFGLSK